MARSRSDEEATWLWRVTYLQLAIALPLFVAWPVEMPRDLFYGDALFGVSDALWRWFDEPRNCFPSLHAANGLFLAQVNWQRGGRWRWPATLLGLGIVASTVLVKQHYVVDVAAGAAVYAVGVWFFKASDPQVAIYEGWRF